MLSGAKQRPCHLDGCRAFRGLATMGMVRWLELLTLLLLSRAVCLESCMFHTMPVHQHTVCNCMSLLAIRLLRGYGVCCVPCRFLANNPGVW